MMADVLADTDAPREVVEGIADAMPYPTVALAEADLTVTQRIVDDLPEDSEPDERARWLHTLGLRRHQVGHVQEAPESTQEAVTLYRELAAAAPERFRPKLATSLNNLGIILSTLGRNEEGQAHRDEASVLADELDA